MTESDDQREKAISRLDEKLQAFEAKRAPASSVDESGISEGYRLLAGMLSGVLGGLGLGWFFDHVLHTSPFGLIGGLLIGTGASIYSTVRAASRMSDAAAAKSGPAKPAPIDDDDDDD
jgi:ATP synthase protein I